MNEPTIADLAEELRPITVREAAQKWGCCYAWAARLTKQGRVQGAYKRNGWEWLLPHDAEKPELLVKWE